MIGRLLRIILIGFFTLAFLPRGFSAGTEMRKIKLGIAVSQGFKSQPNWKSEFEQRLAYVSRIFESEFRIQFVIEKFWEWNSAQDTYPPRMLLEDLQNKFPLKDVDVVIGLTSVKNQSIKDVRNPDTIGQAKVLAGYLVLRYPMDKLYRVQEQTVLAHELGHLFGAVHEEDQTSIMFPIIHNQIPTRFDTENHDIISGTRMLNFRQGVEALPKLAIQRLLGSYLKMAASDQPFDFFYTIGLLYARLGQYDDTLKAWKKAESIMPADGKMHYDLGMLYYQMKDYLNAVKQLAAAIRELKLPSQKPYRVRALQALGEVYLNQNDFMSAYNAFSRALTDDPKNKEVKRNLAIVQLRRGQVDEAIRALESLYYQDTNNATLNLNLGIAYFEKKRLAESERYFKRVLEIVPERSEDALQANMYLGRICFQNKKPQEAINRFSKACSLRPSVDCFKGMAQMHYDLKQWDFCISTLAASLQINKEDSNTYSMIGMAYIQKNQPEQAMSFFKEALKYEQDPKAAAGIYQNIGYLCLQQEWLDEAIKEFQYGIAKDWSNVSCYMGIGLCYMAQNSLGAAKKTFEEVLRLDPKHAKAKELLGQVNETLKKISQRQGEEIHLQKVD